MSPRNDLRSRRNATGRPHETGGMNDRDRGLIRQHIDWLRRRGTTDATRHHRTGVLRRLSQQLPDGLADATEDDLELWQSQLRVSLSAIATYTTHVRGFYAWCEDTGLVDASPARRLPVPRVPARQARPIPEDELALAVGCADEPMRTWLLLAGYMGLRAGEIAGIRREDVAEVAGRTTVSGTGKGDKPFRLPVPDPVLPFLAAHLSGGSGPLWRLQTGGAMTGNRVTVRTSRYLRSIGLPYTLHQLRHRFGTELYRQSRDPVLVQEVLRHASLQTTRLYVAQASEEATAALDELATSLTAQPSASGASGVVSAMRASRRSRSTSHR